MDSNKPVEDRNNKKFDLLDLSEYDYIYKPEPSFEPEFNFSMTNETKFSSAAPAEPAEANRYFLDEQFSTYAAHPPSSHVHAQQAKEKSVNYFSTNNTRASPDQGYLSFSSPSETRPTHRNEYDYYPPGSEHAVFVNANQYQYIKRRKERRDYLDTLEKKTNAAYQHESRHKHAMKRPRAPSGRFLTKEEAFLEDPASKE
ncbi:hypothetical protein NEIG_00019 [Nematocida sp. ERTm5]|nr:hypothetical protein NEIRO02_0030 [Nematocida sp. AWRm79]KAI5182472.1 hypothetical protein NEIRO03_0156 [Nematocida sp. AWRm78]OAG30507.1 hypothetical protein NEIG_00019 [Nematocida sp. ERTm5]